MYEKPSWLKGRQKGCSAPTAPADFDPSTTYLKGCLAKTGPYSDLTWASKSASEERALILSVAHGTTPTIIVTLCRNSTDDLLIESLMDTPPTYLWLRLAKNTPSKNTAALIKAQHVIDLHDGDLGTLASALGIVVTANKEWNANPVDITGAPDPSSTWTSGSKILQCIGGVVGVAGVSIFPRSGAIWRELTGYSAEVAGPRSFCPAINPYEAMICGRCGNPLEYSE